MITNVLRWLAHLQMKGQETESPHTFLKKIIYQFSYLYPHILERLCKSWKGLSYYRRKFKKRHEENSDSESDGDEEQQQEKFVSFMEKHWPQKAYSELLTIWENAIVNKNFLQYLNHPNTVLRNGTIKLTPSLSPTVVCPKRINQNKNAIYR